MSADAPAAAPPTIPVFSPRLDEVLGAMVKGEAPNVGRFCGYCYTPLRKKSDTCLHCNRTTSECAPVAKLPMGVILLYKRMRKRESTIVNSFAFGGIFLAVMLFVVLVAVAVYRFNAEYWALGVATLILFITARVFAGLLGGWIGDSVGYEKAHAKLVIEWHEFERARAANGGVAVEVSPDGTAVHSEPAATAP